MLGFPFVFLFVFHKQNNVKIVLSYRSSAVFYTRVFISFSCSSFLNVGNSVLHPICAIMLGVLHERNKQKYT